ncbi:hypothetical protein PR202_gb08503 [Eleusine coracana subsp. coracana]|uniref:Uncharacterized protein n=1 Tax=Eleusine coracana subsp. coracana TaxID=191504 RepID=A0AAV5EEV4_ELECO|nr:hypothetical protein PR202_gb08503 [Eleusine coracana subsp. coracana]
MEVGEEVVRALGAGFDLTSDFRLRFAKASARRLVELDDGDCRDVPLPGGGGAALRGVPRDVVVDKGDRIRFRSDVLEFNQVRVSFRRFHRTPSPSTPRDLRTSHPLLCSALLCVPLLLLVSCCRVRLVAGEFWGSRVLGLTRSSSSGLGGWRAIGLPAPHLVVVDVVRDFICQTQTGMGAGWLAALAKPVLPCSSL